jgi:hypothetical protein
MEVFKVKYKEEEDGDLYAISIVDDPANGFDFIAMSNKVEIKLASDKKKQILYGIVLRPEQKIYREFEDGTPFYLTFDKETIERFSQDFLKKGYQSNSTFNHEAEMKLDGTTVVEQWIVEDKNNDKGNAIGLPVEEGDWCIGMKLSNELWSEYIETGKAKGFSIDSFIQFEKISMNKINMAIPPFHEDCKCELVDGKLITNNETCDYCLEQGNKNKKELSRENNKQENMSMLKKLIKMFSEEEQIKLASLETELGPLTADAFEVGNVVYDAELNPVMNAEFTAEGKKYYTDETGAIKEVEEVEEVITEEEVTEEVALEDVAPEITDEVTIVTEDIVAEVSKPVEEVDVEALKAKIEILTAEVEKLTAQQEAVFNENVELKNLQASTKLKAEVKGKSPITMATKQISEDSTLSAIERITKKINK